MTDTAQRMRKQPLLKLLMLCAVLMLGLFWIIGNSPQLKFDGSLDTEMGSKMRKRKKSIPSQLQLQKAQSRRIILKQDLGDTCNTTFGTTLEENIDKVKSYNFSEADPYFRVLDSQNATSKIILKGKGTSDIEVPTVVTGASSNHFLESLEMLKSLNKVVRSAYTAIEVFYYDLGLEPEEIDQMVLKTRRFVMWMDASIQFRKSDLDQLFIQAKQHGVMMRNNVYSLPAHVHKDTFDFLEETPCLYKGFTEYSAALILFHSGHKVVKNYILDPWIKCALIKECMITKHSEKKLLYCPNHKTFHACHRFDQAVLSLLIFRLFHDSYKDHNIAGTYFRMCRGSSSCAN